MTRQLHQEEQHNTKIIETRKWSVGQGNNKNLEILEVWRMHETDACRRSSMLGRFILLCCERLGAGPQGPSPAVKKQKHECAEPWTGPAEPLGGSPWRGWSYMFIYDFLYAVSFNLRAVLGGFGTKTCGKQCHGDPRQPLNIMFWSRISILGLVPRGNIYSVYDTIQG